MPRALPLVLPLALLPAGAGELAYAPETGVPVTKTFRVRFESELDELSVLANGSDVTATVGDLELTLLFDTAVAVVDVVRAVEDGRPAELERRYDEIGLDVEVELDSELARDASTMTVDSDLAGETVVFRLDPDTGAYDVAFAAEEGGDEALLEGLFEDMDLRALLPPGPVEVGASWEVEPRELAPVLAPGGALGLLQGVEDEEALRVVGTLFGGDLAAVADALFDGEVTATYAGSRERDGRELAVVELALDLDSTTDLAPELRRIVKELEDGPPDDIELDTADLGLALEGGGRLEWDVAAGRFHRFELDADTVVTFDLVVRGDDESLDAQAALSGGLAITADAEP